MSTHTPRGTYYQAKAEDNLDAAGPTVKVILKLRSLILASPRC